MQERVILLTVRKLATQPGRGLVGLAAHLSGTQRRVVRSRDTDTKAPAG